MLKVCPAFFIVAAELRDQIYKVCFLGHHKVTMTKVKHPRDMTNDEAIKHLFHPKVVEHVKAVVKEANAAKPKKKATKR